MEKNKIIYNLLENKLSELISESDNLELMETFAAWQEFRIKINDVILKRLDDFEIFVNKIHTKYKKVLVATVTCKLNDGSSKFLNTTFVDFDRDNLVKKIENKYLTKLVKNEEDNFPYFTDGGFRYEWRNETYTYLAEAYLYEI
jgi:hypothetical protein